MTIKLRPIQESFGAGEISPRLHSRVSSPLRAQGLATLRNMFPNIQGSVISRGGSFFLGNIDDTDARIIPFNIRYEGNGNGIAVLFRDGYCDLYDEHGIIQTALNEFIDPHFEQDDLYWPNGDGLVTYDHVLHTAHLENTSGVDKCWMYSNITGTPSTPAYLTFQISGDGDAYIRVGTSIHGTEIFGPFIYGPGSHQIPIATGGAPDIYVEVRNEGANNTIVNFTDPHYADQVSSDASFVNNTLDSKYIHHALNDQEQRVIITANDYGTELSFTPIGQYPQEVLYLGGAWTIRNMIISNAPADWLVSTTRPSSCAFFQGRLWFVGQNTIWASKSGNYYDFDLGTALDNEGITHEIAVAGDILWIKALEQLIIGTTSGEYIVRSDGGVITPTDINVDVISTFGSSPDQPVDAGDRILFISKDRRKIRSAYYDEFKKGWQFPDITISGEHLTKSRIKEIHYARDPDNLIYCVMEDGTVAVCVYEQYLDINAWATVDNSKFSNYICMGAIITGNGNNMFSVATTEIASAGGSGVINVEHLGHGHLQYMDSTIISVIEADGTINGLYGLDGSEVTVKIENEDESYSLYPDVLVPDVTGKIQLTNYASKVAIVGFPFHQELKTLSMDVGAPGGSGSGMMKHINKIFARIYESALPLINGKRPPDRSPSTPMGYTDTDISDDVQVTNMGRDRRGQITIEQDLPFRLEVQGIFGEVGQKGL